MFMTLDVLKDDILRSLSRLQYANIEAMVVTFDVSNVVRSRVATCTLSNI